jgi:hypothetical protein
MISKGRSIGCSNRSEWNVFGREFWRVLAPMLGMEALQSLFEVSNVRLILIGKLVCQC